MFKPVSSKLDVPALEREQIEVWRERRTMERYLVRNETSERRFSFLDGPITANGPMGVHHAWGRTYKDLYQRYHTMLGERQRYQNGFDCQGLWVEVEVEKELGFNNKRQIEEFGVDRFVELCKARVNTFAALQTEQSKRLGMWMDWEHSYFTNSDENNYTIWAFLKECHGRGLIYKGHDVMPWCPRCGTGLSNMEIATEGYREIRHLSLTLRLPITSPGHDGEDLLVWTTTPWTLSSNVAAAVHPQLTYALVEGADGRRSWVSRGSLSRVMPGASVVREAPGAELLGLAYRGPFDELPVQDGVAHRVIEWDEVSDEEGTGIVHIAPGCGQEDFALAKRDGLPVLDPIDQFGIVRDGYGWQTGRFAGATEEAATDLAVDVAADLERKGLLVTRERYLHHYPVCWRCGTQLVFRLVDEWFIAMDPLREPISAVTRQITWLPAGIGLEERELDWLRNMSDWMISKKRYYGLALPIWECADCAAWEVIGSREELRERAVAGWEAFDGHSPHKPFVDQVEIACASCGGRARRVADVGNPWLDAGIVSFSTLGWNTDRDEWAKWFPADFITEGFPGQFRNWFYALLTMSTVLADAPMTRTIFGYATVHDEHGEEMHKSKGNAIPFDEAAEQIGADVMRWMYSAANPGVNLNFGYGPGHEVVRRFFLPLWNSYGFLVTYARLDGWTPSQADAGAARTLLDRWILSRLDAVVGESRAALDAYDAARAARGIEAFVEDLSNWYVRRNRRRFWKGELDDDKRAAYATLHEVLVTVARLLAPFVPHLADAMWGNLVASVDPACAGQRPPHRLPRAGAGPRAAGGGCGRRACPSRRGAGADRAGGHRAQDTAAAGDGAGQAAGRLGRGAEPRSRDRRRAAQRDPRRAECEVAGGPDGCVGARRPHPLPALAGDRPAPWWRGGRDPGRLPERRLARAARRGSGGGRDRAGARRVPADREGAAGPRGRGGGRPAGGARHPPDPRARGRGAGARGCASAPGPSEGGRPGGQRPRGRVDQRRRCSRRPARRPSRLARRRDPGRRAVAR